MLLTPSNSPELNPIENFFAIVKNKLKDMIIDNEEQVAFEVIKTMFQVTKGKVEGCFKRTLRNMLMFYFNLDRDKILN